MIHNISGFLPLPLPHSLFPLMLVSASWSELVACLNPKMGWWPKPGVVVVKKGGGDGHCGHHTHGNIVKEVSRVKKQKQKTYQRLEMTCLEPLALLGAMVVMVVGDGLVASVVVVHVVL